MFRARTFLSVSGHGRSISTIEPSQVIFSQGDEANAVYFIQSGKIKLSVVSRNGKEAVIALSGPEDFFGEGCLVAGQPVRMATAVAMSKCIVMRLEKPALLAKLQQEPALSEELLKYMLRRTIRIEEDLVDQLFNSSEKKLARALLLLANFGQTGKPETVIPKISQETLAAMIGTTRPRVSFFMNKFRELGFIKYNGTLEIHSSLLNVILQD
ncbi:MAG: Crp/Fnr family transcriptional regulator [Acidobacteriota bacterium]